LSEYVGDMPWQYNVGTLQDLANVPHAHVIPDHLPHTVPMWESWITTTQPLLKGLYNQRRIDAAKRYTVLDDKEHVDRAKPFPHTLTMPRVLRTFCPNCIDVVKVAGKEVRRTAGMYRPVEHECGEVVAQ
jgi:hypothetical protein